MRIEIYSDIVCPWCFIGKRRLERALETAGLAQQAHVRWRPFQLNPTMPRAGMDRRAYLDAKFGGASARQTVEARVGKAGEVEGIVFAFDRIERTPNTFDAHRLMWFAQRDGKQESLAEALFHGYFTEGLDIGDALTLAGVAVGAGLDGEDVRRLLAGGEGVEEVRAEEAAGHRLGIRSVPYVVIDGTYGISGAQPPDLFVSALTRADRGQAERRAGS